MGAVRCNWDLRVRLLTSRTSYVVKENQGRYEWWIEDVGAQPVRVIVIDYAVG